MPKRRKRRAAVVPVPKDVFRVVKPSGTVYWYHQRDRGKPTRGPLTRLPDPGTPEWNVEIARLTAEAPAPSGSIDSMIDAIKATARWRQLKPNSLSLYEAALAVIQAAWGHLPAAKLETKHIQAMMARYADRPAMGNQVLVQIKAVMKMAVQHGLRQDNPAREIDKLPEVGDSAKPLTNAAWAALMAPEAPEALRRFAVLGRATGQRISDLVRMRPMDRDGDGIEVAITKLRGKPHWCPLAPVVIRVIDGWRQFPASPYLMMDGKAPTDDVIRGLWRTYQATKAGAALVGFTPHDLRATKVCDDRMVGHTHQQIAARVGMSMNMVMHYSHHIDQRLMAESSTKTERELKTRANNLKTRKPK
jgi:integrase